MAASGAPGCHRGAARRDRVSAVGAARPELDFVNARFDEVTVAAIDAQGCAKVHQKIRVFRGKATEAGYVAAGRQNIR